MPQSAYSTINSEWISIAADYFNNFNIFHMSMYFNNFNILTKRPCEERKGIVSLGDVIALLNTRPVIHLPFYFQHSQIWGQTQTTWIIVWGDQAFAALSTKTATMCWVNRSLITSAYELWRVHTLPSVQTHLMTSSHRLKKSLFYRGIKP